MEQSKDVEMKESSAPPKEEEKKEVEVYEPFFGKLISVEYVYRV